MSRYDIAIVGMGCIVPGALNTKEYWKNIKSGETFFSEMPERLWKLDNFHSDDRSRLDKTYTKVGSFVEGFEFSPLKYKMPPANMRGIDPAQLMIVEATAEALADAGIEARDDILTNACTIIGASGVDGFAHSSTFLKRHAFLDYMNPVFDKHGVDNETREELATQFAEELDSRGHIWNPSVSAVGAVTSSIANRVAQTFGVRGMNMTVDGACGSSFVAVDVACHALMAGDVDLGIAGGVDLGTNPSIFIGFSDVNGLSSKGMSCPFDASADGLVIGEGVGTVILKRVEDAIANGDKIYGLIRGIGSSSDGAGQAIYAPSVEGRVGCLRNALKVAQTETDEIQFLEAHATSTVVGDANEYDAISTVYGDRKNPQPLLLGSVKHQIGHLKAAAGIVGLIKTALAMKNETYPHLPNFKELTPNATKVSDNLEIPTTPRKWEPNEKGQRIAAVTTSGFGGVNYHLILEQADSYKAPTERVVPDRRLAVVAAEVEVAHANTLEQFWENVKEGKDTFTPLTDPSKYNWEYHHDTGPESERISTHVVSTVSDDYHFDTLRHKIIPKSVSQIAPTQLMALDVTDRLFEKYGLEYKAPKNIGVSLGTMHDDFFPTIYPPMLGGEYTDCITSTAVAKEKRIAPEVMAEACALADQTMHDKYPPVTEQTLPGWMSNVTAGRIANKLNCQGANFTVDCACSSGLASFVPAMYNLMFGTVDMMVTGGVNRQLSDTFTSGVCALGAVATEAARPFDEKGKGYLIGEGAVMYLVKRYKDAVRDGDDILGVVHAVGGSSEADSKSMIAPSQESLERAIENTMKQTDIKPEDIAISETHGSANKLSDIVEARSLASQLRPEGTNAAPVQITAIKSHVGHLYGGAASASMLSVFYSLNTGIVPAIRNLENIRPELHDILDKAVPVKTRGVLPDSAKVGGISTLGLGGANYFGVVTGGNMTDRKSTDEPAPIGSAFKDRSVMRAEDKATEDIFICLAENESDFKVALERALGQEEVPGVISEGNEVRHKMTITFDTQDILRNKIKTVIKMIGTGSPLSLLESQGIFVASVEESSNRLVFCLPGQGVHYISMARFLYDSEPVFRDVVDAVHNAAMTEMQFDLLGHIYGDPDDAELNKNLGTLVGAQTSLYAIEVGLAKYLISKNIVPDVMIGHSFGEVSALAIAGVWSVEDGYKAVIGRIKAAETVRDGDGPELGMASVVCNDSQLEQLLKLGGENVLLTNVNAPGRYIIAGVKEDVKRCVEIGETFGIDAKLLPIGSAFHSKYMEPAREPFKRMLLEIPCNPPQIPILSTITGEYVYAEGFSAEYLAEHLSSQLVTKLNLPREIDRLYSEGYRHFLEVGPRWAMTKMVEACLDGKDFRAVPTLHPKVGDVEMYRRARAFLIATGHMGSAAERADVPGMFSPDFKEYMEQREPAILSLLQEVYDRYLTSLSGGAPKTSPAASTGKRVAAVAPVAPAAAAFAPVPSASVAAKTVAASGDGAGLVVWKERLREKLVETTGYPADMLEDDLDLEADLGVDSVQRAEIWVALTTEYSLDQEVRPGGPRTITNLASVLADMDNSGAAPSAATAAAPAQPVAAPAPAAAPSAGDEGAGLDVWKGRLRDKLVETTGYPAEMLEDDLDLEADLGVDSVQRAEIWVALTTEYSLDQEVRPEGPRTITNLASVLAGMDKGGATPTEVSSAAPAEVIAAPAVASAAGGGGAGLDVWKGRLRDKLVETTGYPAEMLEDDLDLEADLGVDSVQRAEIWVALTTEYSLDQEVRPEGPRTITNLASVLAGMDSGSVNESVIESKKPEGVAALDTTDAAAPADFTDGLPAPDNKDACHLFSLGTKFVDESEFENFECKKVLAITHNNGALLGRLKRRFNKKEIEMETLDAAEVANMDSDALNGLVSGVDTLVYLAHEEMQNASVDGGALQQMLDDHVGLIYGVFKPLISILNESQQPLRLIFPVSLDGKLGLDAGGENIYAAFPVGFVRCLDKELPGCNCQILDGNDMDWAKLVDTNIGVITPYLEIGMTGIGRVTSVLSQVAPSADHQKDLDPGDLVLVTGGARGITFECVRDLARYTGCKLVLTGRTEPVDGSPAWLDAPDSAIDATMRKLEIDMVKNEGKKLPEAKKIAKQWRSQWEVNKNLKKLASEGIEAVYEKCDVSDPAALGNLIGKLSEKEPIRGIVHGSGVQKSAMITDLADWMIDLTLKTKITPVLTMLDHLDWSELKLFSAFGSIAGLFGNAGQSDYALGNDMLAWMVKEIQAMHPHVKCQTVEWTAWVGTGMVSEQEGKRFAEAGLVALTVDTGVPLYMEATTGCSSQRVAAFNLNAAFTAGRPFTEHSISARPRVKLVEAGDDKDVVRFSQMSDTYIDQHLVNLEPVIPGTFVTEIFAESLNKTGLIPSKIQFRRPMQLRGNELEVEVVRDGNSMLVVPTERPADLPAKALANLSFASCQLVESASVEGAKLKMTKKTLLMLEEKSLSTSASFYGMLDDTFYKALKTGPVFRGVRATHEEENYFYSLVTLTSQATAALQQPGDFVFNPVLADMAVQVAAAWAMIRHETMEIPFEIGSLHVAGAVKGEDCQVICKEIEINDTESSMDVAVRNMDGSLVLTMNDLVLKTIMRKN